MLLPLVATGPILIGRVTVRRLKKYLIRIEKAQTASIERIEKAVMDRYTDLDERVTVLESDHQKGIGKRDAFLGIAAVGGAVVAKLADWMGDSKIAGWIAELLKGD
jgi:hypothetical protein